ncbi:hypothetical protein BASA82_001005 [Batrachochytrium salamandrivorans]|uniref:G-protein coupled receptors family 3 profile domain-containing protein n=1 Tax=Batrachochytrium salamandrivorans TaxID=1357716 RepID=A0ABQ8FLD4_9FUNG|nr:hypothetical protein BASA60_009801 [Batrachochytrium salamandrivorans]KAH6575956.1 hypothetical protein BASA62_001701 [Batrachochytrium salamandrivorans]KAH6598845.1 hypothetical protein BASA50_003352 [Batrachochytrium salamandrivorans]KAH9257114.1 hypothetical protein BASA81_004664 [Batrachochytrium salamandrivorans]KAH9261347.1 hypothetical protein BASA82_001005 [Batrachochytrium salamandrivorans]
MSSFLASLSTVSSVFSAIVVYGAGVALGSTKNQFQGIATAVATTGYLAQRITFMILAEDIPDINCATANAASYSFLCIMRLAILAGLTLRARGSISMQFSVVLTSANFVAVVLGIASVGILIYQACVSPYVPGTCIQGLDRTVTFVGNIMFVIALTILTIVLSVPIFKTLAVANTTGPTTSRIHNQIRILSRFLRLFPLGLCVLITVMMVWSSHISNVFVFLVSLIFADSCQIWLLLFPMVVIAGDNGETSQGNSNSQSGLATAQTPVFIVRSPPMSTVTPHGSFSVETGDKFFSPSAYHNNTDVPF